MNQPEVVIIGAGVLGLCLAQHLSSRRISVTIIEREKNYAVHASGKNAGMLRQLYRHPQLTEWAFRSLETLPEGVRLKSFQRTGSLILGREVPEHHSELFQGRTFAVADGEGGRRVVPAVYTPSDGLLDSKRYCETIFELTDRRYVNCRFLTTVVGLSKSGSLWETQLGDGTTLRSPWVVNAAGAWINSVFARDQQHLAVQAESFARHLFVIDGWRNGYMPQTGVGYFWDEASEYYMRLWFGDSRIVSLCDRVPATPAQFVPETGLITRLAEFLQDRFADQAQALRLLRSWFCFRTYAEDQLPLWGEDPAASGLFWLAAFGGFGMSTSYAAAADAARHIAGERSLSLPDFNPNRARTWESAPEVANY